MAGEFRLGYHCWWAQHNWAGQPTGDLVVLVRYTNDPYPGWIVRREDGTEGYAQVAELERFGRATRR